MTEIQFPEILIPLIARDITRVPEQILTFWHDTYLYIFPPGAQVTVTYRPRPGFLYLVFGMTMGKPRDFATGDTLTTDDYGFYHEHPQMKWHWDPATESIYDFDYPHWLEVTDDKPVTLSFYNNSGLTIIQDFSIWLFECGELQWTKHAVPYLRGLYRTAYEKGIEEPWPPEAST